MLYAVKRFEEKKKRFEEEKKRFDERQEISLSRYRN